MKECACSCDIDSEDAFAEVIKKDIVAKHEHVCGECNDKIQVGDSYRKTSAFQEPFGECEINERYSYYTCEYCAKVQDICGCFIYGSVWEDLYENVENGCTMPADIIMFDNAINERRRERGPEYIVSAAEWKDNQNLKAIGYNLEDWIRKGVMSLVNGEILCDGEPLCDKYDDDEFSGDLQILIEWDAEIK